jgi:hypothetical protein
VLPITHGIVSQGGAAGLNVTLDLQGVFGATSLTPGSSGYDPENNPGLLGTNSITAADSHNMPNSGPYSINVAGTTYEWLRIVELDGASITVTGNTGGTAWNGDYQTLVGGGTYQCNVQVESGQVIGPGSFIGGATLNWSLKQPNSKGQMALDVTFFAAGTPANGSFIDFRITITMTEVSSGLTGSAQQIIRIENQTGIM